ncbi:hypothetical protein COCNU_scaffold005031G000010 [Cocos nucifera]|nr:hypothetical protein [Cocos nucifera]
MDGCELEVKGSGRHVNGVGRVGVAMGCWRDGVRREERRDGGAEGGLGVGERRKKGGNERGDEFRRRFMGGRAVTSLGGFDTCYSGAAVKVPVVELEFEGMRAPLPKDNMVIQSRYGNTVCLAMAVSPGNVNSVVNAVANMVEQNHRVVFDGAGGRLKIAYERCT